MANRHRGQVELELGGNTEILTFDYNSICELEGRCGGQSIDALFFSGGISRSVIREALFVGLKSQKRRGFTPKAIGRLIAIDMRNDEKTLMKLIVAVLTAVMYGNGAKEDEVERTVKAIRQELDDDYEDEGGDADEDDDEGVSRYEGRDDRTVATVDRSEDADNRPLSTIGAS